MKSIFFQMTVILKLWGNKVVVVVVVVVVATRAVLKIGEYLTIIPRACVGYEMIDSQRGA